MAKSRNKGKENPNYKTGLSKSRTYGSWASMIQRCTNPNRPEYNNYGGREIIVCEEWLSFESFLSDMGECPSNNFTLERVNNDSGYNKHNCRWATYSDNLNNKRSSVKYTHNGETLTITQWSRRLGCTRGKLFKRIYRGWSFEDAITKP